ncbi:hypothetical protein ACP70R_005592 [Stipagrostis hirtigluma subsp. patula]
MRPWGPDGAPARKVLEGNCKRKGRPPAGGDPPRPSPARCICSVAGRGEETTMN